VWTDMPKLIVAFRNFSYARNPLTPNDHYSGRTAPLTPKRCILYIYSTNIGTEYFKHGIYSQFFSPSKCGLFHNSNVFGSCIIHILYTGCAKIKKNNSGAKRLVMKYQKAGRSQDYFTMTLKQHIRFT
jgi:hypothetical protein